MITCGTCGAEVIWCRTETGKRMPIDAKPCADGNLLLDASELLPTVRPVSRIGRVQQQGPLYKSHFATCKHAAHHRKAPKKPLAPPGPVLFEGGDGFS